MFKNLLNEGTVAENMATRDVCSYFICKKAEKKDSQVHILQVVKISGNVTVAEVSAVNTKLKNSSKEKYEIDLPSKVKNEFGKYAHRYGTQATISHFHGKYQQYTLKHATINNWTLKFSNPQKEVGEPPEKFNKKVNLHWLEKSCW